MLKRLQEVDKTRGSLLYTSRNKCTDGGPEVNPKSYCWLEMKDQKYTYFYFIFKAKIKTK